MDLFIQLGTLAAIITFSAFMIVVTRIIAQLLPLRGPSDTDKIAREFGLVRLHESTVMRRERSIAMLRWEDKQKYLPAKHRLANAIVDLLSGNSNSKREAPDKPKRLRPIAVITFKGDLFASESEKLARLVDEIVINKEQRFNGVAVIVDSPGGSVPEYGQCRRELERIKEAGLPLEVLSDHYLASGGYLMGSVADKIITSPKCVVGSIGVIKSLLNKNKLLTSIGIQPEQVTAGEYKRTMTENMEITDEHRKHEQTKINITHEIFINDVRKNRPQIDVKKVCNGDHWLAEDSVSQGLGLVDRIASVREYLLELSQEFDLVYLDEKPKSGGSAVIRFVHQIGSLIKSQLFGLGTQLS